MGENIRLDFSPMKIGDLKKTPQGGVLVPAAISRTGVLEYNLPDGSTRLEYRPPDEVFKADSLETLQGVAVTDMHPAEAINPENFKRLSVGNVSGEGRRDGDKLIAVLSIDSPEVVEMIEGKERRECSAGYKVDLEEKPGVTPEGERYDAIQRNIVFNHVAIGPSGWGRSGPDVGLRADSSGEPSFLWAEYKEDEMKTKKDEEPEIEKEDEEKAEDSKEEETKDSEKEKKAEDSEEKEDSLGCKTQARIDSLESEKSKLQSKVESLKKELSEVRSDSFIDERIKARVALISEAKEKAGQDLVLDGLSEKEIKIKAIEAQRSDLKLDGKSNDYIDAAFELLTVKEEEIFKKDSSEKRTTVEKLAQERQMKAQSYHIKGNK